MKKFFYIFLIFLFYILFSNKVFAQNEVSFIYLNGSNTNTKDSKEEFLKGVDYLHREITKQFMQDELIKTKWLNGGELTINKKAIPFYWGDFSKNEIEIMNEEFNFLKAISPKPANYVRKFIAMCLHDAIWVSKTENMYPIIQKLHNIVMEEISKSNKVVIVGYSAGTFIVQQYLAFKAPVINIKEAILKSKLPDEFKTYVSYRNYKNSCTDAIFKSKLVTYDIENEFVFESDIESFKDKIDLIDDYTIYNCMPKSAVIGGINYASPYALFYSDMYDKEYKMNELMALTYKFIVENNIFWLTVNYSDDPLGFPVSKNVTFDEIEKTTKLEIEPNGGFIFDKSNKTSRRTFLFAHLSYFKTARRYAKILVEAINEGYDYFYSSNNSNNHKM